MFKGRFGLTVGVQNRYSPHPQAVLYIGCTHAHKHDGFQALAPVEGISWFPREEQELLGVHGTHLKSWRSLVFDGAMITRKRGALCYSTFRRGMVVKEMRQPKDAGFFIFVDPVRFIELGFDVTM